MSFIPSLSIVYPSSSNIPVHVYQWRAHSRAVLFHTLNIGQRDTRLCPYLVYFATLYPLPLPHLLGYSVLIPLFYSSIPFLSASAAAAAVSLDPARSSPAFPATASPLVPPASSPRLCTGTELDALQYTAQPYSAFAECRFTSAQTTPPLSLPSLRYTPILCLTSAVAAAPSVAAPLGLGIPP